MKTSRKKKSRRQAAILKPSGKRRTYRVAQRCLAHLTLAREEITEAMKYVFAVVSNRHGCAIHGFAVGGRAWEIVLTAPKAALDAFAEDVDEMMHEAVTTVLEVEGPVWPGKAVVTEIAQGEPTLRALADMYVRHGHGLM